VPAPLPAIVPLVVPAYPLLMMLTPGGPTFGPKLLAPPAHNKLFSFRRGERQGPCVRRGRAACWGCLTPGQACGGFVEVGNGGPLCCCGGLAWVRPCHCPGLAFALQCAVCWLP
jgi:hypothetical protein